MKKLTYANSFLLALMFAAASKWLDGWMGFVSLVIGLIFLFIGMEKLSTKRNGKAIREALSTLDEVYGGLRFIGKEAEVISTIRLDDRRSPGPLAMEQLCRTHKGQWFTITFEIKNGTGIAYGLRITETMSENEAKKWLLMFDQDVYKSMFGAIPEIEVA